MTIESNFPIGQCPIVAGSRFAAAFDRLSVALSANRFATPNLTDCLNAIILAGGALFFPAWVWPWAAVRPVPAADFARARSMARIRTL